MLVPVFRPREISPGLKQIQENVTTTEPSRNQDCPGVSLLGAYKQGQGRRANREVKQKQLLWSHWPQASRWEALVVNEHRFFWYAFSLLFPYVNLLGQLDYHQLTVVETEAHRVSEIFPKSHSYKRYGQGKTPTCLSPRFFHLSIMPGCFCFRCLFIL